MAIEILMPKWGLTMKEGKVTKWLKAEGEAVKKGEPLLEVETSKISNQIEAPADGILFQIVVPAGETAAIRTVLAVLAAEGETPEKRQTGARAEVEPTGSEAKTAGHDASKRAKGGFVLATPAARRLAKERGIDLGQITGTGPRGRVTEADVRAFRKEGADYADGDAPVNASDSAMATAQKAGIDISQMTGSGPDGRIVKADVLRMISPAAQRTAEMGTVPRLTPGSLIQMEGMRGIIADNMMASIHNSAQVSVFVEFDATRLVSFRSKVRQRYADRSGPKISFNAIIALAVCRALADHPIMNSRLGSQGIELCQEVNLGIAVALADGLVVPNVKAANRCRLPALAAKIDALVQKARDNRLTLDDIQDGTFTISNVSMLGVDGFTPILNPPETGILGVGRAADKPAVHKGRIAVRTLMTLSLTFDHRVVDGAPAMRFLRTVADCLEDPALIMT